MRILEEGKDIEYVSTCKQCNTRFAYFRKDTYELYGELFYCDCPLCSSSVEVTFVKLEETMDKPKSCYDCIKSNTCELFVQNGFREKSKIVILDNSRLCGCPYDKEESNGGEI